jgi:hypothetical protein
MSKLSIIEETPGNPANTMKPQEVEAKIQENDREPPHLVHNK